MEKREEIFRLIQRYRQGIATEEEVRHLLHQIQSGVNSDVIETAISAGLLDEPSDWMKQSADTRQKLDVLFEQMMQRRVADVKTLSSPRAIVHAIRKWLPISAAAVALIALTIGWIYFMNQSQPIPKDIEPGGNRATLTLGDGQIIELSEAQEGIVVGEEVRYLDGTNVSATRYAAQESGPNEYPMSLSTPQRGTYQITLPDGTRVWLNAASTLRYPVRFNSQERVVELAGEAYFEVRNSEAWPFKVVSESQTIEVLGTSFNVNAYPDEKAMTTTLVSGSLRVTLEGLSDSQTTSVVLKPGEVAIHAAGQLEKRSGDLAASTAWKEGYFVFNNATMETIAAQIGRWYGIEVDCIDLPHQTFSAEIPRSVKLSTLLKLIESTSDLHCELIYNPDNPNEERRLMITK